MIVCHAFGEKFSMSQDNWNKSLLTENQVNFHLMAKNLNKQLSIFDEICKIFCSKLIRICGQGSGCLRKNWKKYLKVFYGPEWVNYLICEDLFKVLSDIKKLIWN